MPLQIKSRIAKLTAVMLVLSVFSTATAGETGDSPDSSKTFSSWSLTGEPKSFGEAPAVPDGPLSEEIAHALESAFGENLQTGHWGQEQYEALALISRSKDPRLAWIISDFMRIAGGSGLMKDLLSAAQEIMGVDIQASNPWGETTDYLIAWDIPAPPGYLSVKRNIYTLIVPTWNRIFVEGDIDWRYVSWGGVRIDDRAYNETDRPCNCIPAADNPEVTDVSGAEWLDENDVIFGIEVNQEFRAYPRQIMEVREMVNDRLGGRDLGIPYCTLCGAARAYFTDNLPDGVQRPVLRTSGLLIRSNKVMFDINTYSVFDTFKGAAVTGPLADRGVKLKQTGVVTTTWGEWKAAHPETTVLAEELALGRNFDFRNNRDAEGPIFPIGDVDPRLPVHEDILGIVTASGRPVAFRLEDAISALKKGEQIAFENVRLILDGGGVRAVDNRGMDLGGHQAFWFAWSQFYPKTELWQLN